MIVFDPGTVERPSGPYYQRRYQILVEEGYLCVAVDFPCQGRDERPGEPKSLNCWRHRIEHRQKAFNADFNARINKVGPSYRGGLHRSQEIGGRWQPSRSLRVDFSRRAGGIGPGSRSA